MNFWVAGVRCVLFFTARQILRYFRDVFSGIFSTESTVIQAAGLRIVCILFFEPLCNVYEILAGALRGSGHALLPAIMTIVGTCAFRIIWICTVFAQHMQLSVLYVAFPLSWVLTSVLMLGSFLMLRPLRMQPEDESGF